MVAPGIAAGIALHRAIDRFADRHPAFKSCLGHVAAPRRRYAGVIVDIFFDHCLARCWTDYSATSLDSFVEHVCTQVERQADFIPVQDRARLERMLESRWLGLYATRAGLDQAFAGLARRARFGRRLQEAATDSRSKLFDDRVFVSLADARVARACGPGARKPRRLKTDRPDSGRSSHPEARYFRTTSAPGSPARVGRKDTGDATLQETPDRAVFHRKLRCIPRPVHRSIHNILGCTSCLATTSGVK